MDENNNLQLAFLSGVKAGMEAFACGLEEVAKANNGQVSYVLAKMVLANAITDVELKLSCMENGKDLIKAMNSEDIEINDTVYDR